MRLSADGERVEWRAEATEEGTAVLHAELRPRPAGCDRPLQITFEVARAKRPIDLGINADRRRLGILVNWVEFEPVNG